METNSFAIDKSIYKDEGEFWRDVSNLIRIFTKQEYEVLFRYEDCDVFIIEAAYDPHKNDYGADRFMLVSAEEAEKILFERDDKKEETDA